MDNKNFDFTEETFKAIITNLLEDNFIKDIILKGNVSFLKDCIAKVVFFNINIDIKDFNLVIHNKTVIITITLESPYYMFELYLSYPFQDDTNYEFKQISKKSTDVDDMDDIDII